MDELDRTASLMSPAKLAQMKPKPATTPAAWLTQMAADAGHMHVKRIGELGELLRGQARLPGLAAIAPRFQKLADDLPDLDFSLLEPRGGWWARASGKKSGGGAEFAIFDMEHTLNASRRKYGWRYGRRRWRRWRGSSRPGCAAPAPRCRAIRR